MGERGVQGDEDTWQGRRGSEVGRGGGGAVGVGGGGGVKSVSGRGTVGRSKEGAGGKQARKQAVLEGWGEEGTG